MSLNYNLIVIPTYQELYNLDHIFDMFDKLLSEDKNINYRLFFIVDGDDGTVELLKSRSIEYLQDTIRYIYLGPKKGGLGSAYNRGFTHIRKHFDLKYIDTIITIDADGSHDMSYIPMMYDRFLSGYDFVVGSRYSMCGYRYEDEYNYFDPKSRLSWFYNFLFFVISKNKIFDKTSGFRLLKSAYIDIFDSWYPNNFTYNFYTNFLLAEACKFNTYELPIIFKKRFCGDSKFNFILAVRDYAYIVYILIKKGILFK